MEISPVINQENLARTFEVFIDKERVNHTALPQINNSKEDGFEKKYGKLYTASAIAAGVGILALLYKGHKFEGLSKYFKNNYTNMMAKTAEAKNNFANMDIVQRTKYKLSSMFVNLAQRSQAIGNVNPIKDIAFDRTCKFLHIKPMFDKITNFFIGISKRLTTKKYKIAKKSFDEFGQLLEKALNKKSSGLKGDAKTIAKIRNLYATSGLYLEDISKGFDKRFQKVLNALNKDVTIKSRNGIIHRTKIEYLFLREPLENLLEGFIPRKVIYPMKKEIFTSLIATKQKISNNVIDLSKNMDLFIDEIFKNLPMEASATRKKYFNLKSLVAQFANPKQYNIKHRREIKAKIIKELQSTIRLTKTTQSDQATPFLKDLEKFVTSDSKGNIEEIISLLKQHGLKSSDPQLYQNLIKARNKVQTRLNDAVKFETENTFGKILDYSLHTLPTDLMTQTLGAGTLLYILLNSKNSTDEKISKTLKNGIPIIGGLGVMFACNVRQIASGPSALFLGIISTFVLNRLGSLANKSYLKNKQNNINKTA